MVFDELQKGFNTKNVVVRVLHFWEARNPKKGNLLMGLELLLIDEKSTVIQAFIPANRIGFYEANLKVDVVYKISRFLVVNNKSKYRVSCHKFLIQFTPQTTLVQDDEAGQSIERQKFRFRSFSEFEEAVDVNEDLYDVIGKVVLINDDNYNYPVHCKTHDPANSGIKSKIDLHLQLKDGPVVRVTLWGNVAANFQKKVIKSGVKPVVLLATTVNPKIYRDIFCLNSTSSTRIFFDKDVEPSTEYLTWLGEDGKSSVIGNNFTSEVTKSEPATIAELYKFLKNDTPQKASFSCIVTISDILPHYGWNYIACTTCASKLGRTDTSLVCSTCKNTNAVGVIRYRVELTVCDKEDVATFVIFDRDTTKLTGRRAADILEPSVQGDENGDQNGANASDSSIPQCLIDLVGRTFKFEVTLTPYNFTATRQTITVTRILEEIVNDDKTLEEEAAETNKMDNKEVHTTGLHHGDVVDEDNDTVDINHKEKRPRHK